MPPTSAALAGQGAPTKAERLPPGKSMAQEKVKELHHHWGRAWARWQQGLSGGATTARKSLVTCLLRVSGKKAEAPCSFSGEPPAWPHPHQQWLAPLQQSFALAPAPALMGSSVPSESSAAAKVRQVAQRPPAFSPRCLRALCWCHQLLGTLQKGHCTWRQVAQWSEGAGSKRAAHACHTPS